MRAMITALLLLGLTTAFGQKKTLEYPDAYFRGTLVWENGDTTTHSDCLVSELLDIHDWVIEYDTTTGLVGVFGFNDTQESPAWEEILTCSSKITLQDATTKIFTMVDTNAQAAFSIGYKKTWKVNSKGKRVRKWKVNWVSVHSLDYPDYSTRTYWSENLPKASLR